METADKNIYVTLILLGIFTAFIFLLFIFNNIDKNKNEDTSLEQEERISFFENIEIEAPSVIVFDLDNEKVIFEKNSESQLPLASLAKVLVAKIVFDNNILNSNIKITEDFLKEEGDNGLVVNEEWSIKNLSDFTLMESSNDGAKALASAAVSLGGGTSFIDLMNQEAARLGMKQTYFLNSTGLDESLQVGGAYGSLKDMATLFQKTLKENPELFEASTYPTLNINNHTPENTNELTKKLPGIIASKTGFTDLAGGNLVMAFDFGPMKRILIGVMGSSADGRFTDMEKLYLTALKEINK